MLSSSFTLSKDACQEKDEQLSSSFSLTLNSPSKINLFFRILSKRPDGYHEIASLYQAIALYDQITFSSSDAQSFSCSDPSLSTDDSNLCVKAFKLFQKKTALTPSISIHLDKKVPMQAGLGGGSANAATVLYGLNKLMGQPLSIAELSTLSAELGSDVPFFFSKGTAFCRGRGENLTDVNFTPQIGNITIVKPKQGLSTPLVYKACDPSSFPSRDPLASLALFQQGSYEFYNDLEIPSFLLLPSLKELKGLLESAGFTTVLMCGSGTAFFCLGDADLPSLHDCFVQRMQTAGRSEMGWYE